MGAVTVDGQRLSSSTNAAFGLKPRRLHQLLGRNTDVVRRLLGNNQDRVRGTAARAFRRDPRRCALAIRDMERQGRRSVGRAALRDDDYRRTAGARCGSLAARDCVLLTWATWPLLRQALELIEIWGFAYKTCGFDWTKADASQLDMFRDDTDVAIGMGYWTRSNTEPCLLATRGKPKRLNADVRQGIVEPRREHSRKPDCVHERIERLVAGPYLELFARQRRPGWSAWGNEVGKYDAQRDIAESVKLGFEVIRARMRAGGKGWGGG
jgi:N6-adenosine-specific RNA methylase IME4